VEDIGVVAEEMDLVKLACINGRLQWAELIAGFARDIHRFTQIYSGRTEVIEHRGKIGVSNPRNKSTVLSH
jgi:hypothetical protein